jgi:hypothetical protein
MFDIPRIKFQNIAELGQKDYFSRYPVVVVNHGHVFLKGLKGTV